MKIASGPELFELIANDPSIYPAVSCKGCGRITFDAKWADCIGIEFGDEGGFIFHRQEPGIFEVHTLFLRRARRTSEHAREALAYMFDQGGAELILTMVPRDLPHVRRFAERHGFVLFHSEPGAWPRESGPVDLDYFELSKEAFQCLQSQ